MASSLKIEDLRNNSTQSNLESIDPITSPSNLRLVKPQGQIQIHTYPYRGSYPKVFREAIRSAGLGRKVMIAQLLKGGVSQGVQNGINLCGTLNWIRPNIEKCITSKNLCKNSRNAFLDLWDFCKDILSNSSIDKIILDEIGLALKLNLIKEKELIHALEKRSHHLDVILTGQEIPSAILSLADQVTQLRGA